MRVFCFGDSLTEGDYGIKGMSGIGNVQRENYPYFLGELSGFEVFNFGKCGYTVTAYLDYLYGGNVTDENPDVIIIMLGTNGGIEAREDNRCFCDYKKILEFCRKSYPTAALLLCTPPFATENSEYSNCGYLPQITKAAEAVSLIARQESLPLIDLFNYGEFCESNVAKYQSNDGLHFVKEGYIRLAEFILGEMKKYVV